MENKTTCSFKKGNRRNIRKRQTSSSEEEDTKIFKKAKPIDIPNPMIQGTSKKDRSQQSAVDISKELSYASTKSSEPEGPSDMGATKIVEIDTHKDMDARSIMERSSQMQEVDPETTQDGKEIYRGLKNVKTFKEIKEKNCGMVKKGPIRAPDNLRATVRWDYQPDICKDYKETGFCGFGDSCKFMHDRSDYKHGWQLEQDMANNTYQEEDDDTYVIHSDSEELPFKCPMCRNTFVDPIITKCKHYFCEKCALKQLKKTMRCYACSQSTDGFFKPAQEIIKKLKAETKEDEDSD